MKNVWLTFGIVILIGCLALFLTYQFLLTKSTNTVIPQPTNTPTPTTEPKPEKTITYGGETYAYSYFAVQDPQNISLIPNFTSPKDAKSLMLDNLCTHAISGGFYDTSNNPLGYFRSNGKTLGREIESALVNGFIWADTAGSVGITRSIPDLTSRFAIQTGPMLMAQSVPLPLSMNSDFQARRIVAAIANDRAFVFFALYNGEFVFLGPTLADLPGIMQAINDKEQLGITEAINLDGGSASFYNSNNTTLSELTPVGSLFCIK